MAVPKSLTRKKKLKRTSKLWGNQIQLIAVREQNVNYPEGGGVLAYTRGGDARRLRPALRGVNFGFWSLLGCSGQNVIIFSREGLV